MSRQFGAWELIALAGAAQGVFLAVVLWAHRRGRRLANRVLGVLVFAFSLHLLHIVLYWSRSLSAVPHFWGAVWMFPYAYGVLLYLYARVLTEPDFRWRWRQAWHFLPFLVSNLLFARFYVLSAEIKRRALVASYEPAEPSNYFVLAVWALQFAHFALYLGLSRGRFSESAERHADHRWLRRLMTAFAASFTCWFVNGFAVALGLPYVRGIDVAATLAMTVTIYAIGYTALSEPEIFLGEIELRRRKKYAGSSLSEAEATDYERKLLELMDSHRPYKDAELKLEDLAGLVGLRTHQLSQLLNQRLGKNFNDFVNRYRVEEAKRLLSEGAREQETLLSLAFEAGFNNKTSFNEAFKKYTHMTPSRFRASMRAYPQG